MRDAILWNIFITLTIIAIFLTVITMGSVSRSCDPCDVNRDGRVTLTDMVAVKERLLNNSETP